MSNKSTPGIYDEPTPEQVKRINDRAAKLAMPSDHPLGWWKIGDAEDARDFLIDQVITGEISPDEAEQRAAEHGLDPFAYKPEISAVKADDLSYWSVPMAIAWIATTNYLDVGRQEPKYRQRSLEWRPCTYTLPDADGEPRKLSGYELTTPAATTSRALREIPGGDDAYRKLWKAFGDGKLKLISVEQSEHRVIPAPAFASHEITDNEGRQSDVLSFNGVVIHRDLVVSRAELEELFPEMDTASFQYPPVRLTEGSSIEDALTMVVVEESAAATTPEQAFMVWIESHNGQRHPGRTADLAHMRSIFPDITSPTVRALRAKLAPAEWKERGRPKN